MKYRRAWDGGEWQGYALQLVQLRHGHQNVQSVPDHVGGDAGLEFIHIGGINDPPTLYQCYAPGETVDNKKAAIAQRAKANKDLQKLILNKDKLCSLLKNLSIKRWILLCPFLDNKDVIGSTRAKAVEIRKAKLPFLAEDFDALVHCQEDFAGEIEILRQQTMMPMTLPILNADTEFAATRDGTIGSRITEKLNRGFKASLSPEQIEQRRNAYVRAHLYRENLLEELKLNHPALWDRSIQTLSAEEERLAAVGASSDIPGIQLKESVERIELALQKDLPNMALSFATQVAIGTVGEWLIRCPLDFPGDDA
ncbi:hypothetical protein [Bosea sp. (in: a-proteobacteria)]|uniref:hypothetical protein n=1 Tax=Bosea sp. (in: a-proteobacteria) TaxID=1871050 RepID=UPI0027369017|nr:hypothetical protein [Bosea sp. (in: a-proteobacteria)]MDP3410528.1 hypothetical protein [Bosea sp. (in: a-proteobacteria)]